MYIVINSRFLTQNITGVQRFAIEISKQLKKQLGDNVQLVSPKNIIHNDLAKELDVKVIGNKTGHLWEQLDLPKYLKSIDSPLVLNLANTAPLFYNNKMTVVHSLSFSFKKWNSLKFYYFYKFLIPLVLKTSKHVFTVSDYTLNEIVKYYPNIKNLQTRMSVVYNGHFYSNVKIKNDGSNYILYVGTVSKSKNIKILVDALKLINKRKIIINLKIVGGANSQVFENEKIDNFEWIEFIGHINDTSELASLYSNAKLFVFPSLYESFGIPPVEAQSFGCPVLSSNTTSLPEICGDGAIYFNPYDINDLKEKIELVLNDENLKNELKTKGFENIKRFSWEQSAKKIIEVIERLK